MNQLNTEIYRDRIKNNIGIVTAHIPISVNIIGVVKSDGYGHGACEVAKILIGSGINYLAVSDLEEALILRKKFPEVSIIVLGEIGARRLAEAVLNELTITLSSINSVRKISIVAEAVGTIARVHVKVDTGMGRFGMPPKDVMPALQSLSNTSCINLEGIFSHLSATFNTDIDSNNFTIKQLNIFENICMDANKEGLLPEMVHIGSSTALIGFPEKILSGHFNSIRIGTLFLGYEERKSCWQRHVQPAAEISTNICMIRTLPPGHAVGYAKTFTTSKETRLAILPIGYGHGFHRDFGNVGQVMVNNCRANIIGKPSLGQLIIDVTNIPDVKVGDRVTLAGVELSAFEEANKIGRGTWEVILPLLEHSEISYV